jgi:cytochrome c2
MRGTSSNGGVRLQRFFGTAVGWLIGLGMVLFGLVGFMAINQATPLSPTSYLAAPTSSKTTTTPTVPRPPATKHGPGTTPGKTTSTVSTAQLVSIGQSIITSKCEACHVVNGSGGNIGPNLDDVFAGKTLPGMVPNGHPTEASWLTQWVTDPQKVWPQATMPDLGLTAQQVQGVVAYLTTKVH